MQLLMLMQHALSLLVFQTFCTSGLRVTTDGCACMPSWTYTGFVCSASCCNPDSYSGGDWCFVAQPASCQGASWGVCASATVTSTTTPTTAMDTTATLTSTLTGTLTVRSTSFTTSEASASSSTIAAHGRSTASGCLCMSVWTYQGYTCSEHCCNPDGHTGGAWCFVVDAASCQGATWGVCGSVPTTSPTKTTSNTLSFRATSFTATHWTTTEAVTTASTSSSSAPSTTSETGTMTSTVSSALTGTSSSSTRTLRSASLTISETSTMTTTVTAQGRSTNSECPCMAVWMYQGYTCSDYCCNPDGHTGGAWCFVVDAVSCHGATWGVCRSLTATIPTTATSGTLSLTATSFTSTHRTAIQTITVATTTISSSASSMTLEASTITSTVRSTPTVMLTSTSSSPKPTLISTSVTMSETSAPTRTVVAPGRSTDSGCPCMSVWTYQDYTCSDHCCNPDGATGGAWCFVVDAVSCQGATWGTCRLITTTTPTTTSSEILSFTATSFTSTRGTASQSITVTTTTTISISARSTTLGASTVTSTVRGASTSSLTDSSSSTLTLRSTSVTRSETSATTRTVASYRRGTNSGCPCKAVWMYQDFTCSDYCCNPDGHMGGAWCFVVDAMSCQGATWGVCRPFTTITPTTTTSNSLSFTLTSFTSTHGAARQSMTVAATTISSSASSTTFETSTVTSTVMIMISVSAGTLAGTPSSSTLTPRSTSVAMSETSATTGTVVASTATTTPITTSSDILRLTATSFTSTRVTASQTITVATTTVPIFASSITLKTSTVTSTVRSTPTSRLTGTTVLTTATSTVRSTLASTLTSTSTSSTFTLISSATGSTKAATVSRTTVTITGTSGSPSTVIPAASATSTTTGTSTGMVSISSDMYLLVDDAQAFVSSLNSDSNAMDALRAGVVAPFHGLTSAMVIISSVTISRRLAKSRLLTGTVTVEYELNYPAAIGLTWQDISQAPVQIAAAINGHFQKASISLSVTDVTLADPNPTTTRTQTSQSFVSQKRTITGIPTSVSKSMATALSSTLSAGRTRSSAGSSSTTLASETGTAMTGASNSSQIAVFDLDLKSAQSVSRSNSASSTLTSTTTPVTPQSAIGSALLASILTFPSTLAAIIVISFLFLSMIFIFARQWYKRRRLNEIKNHDLGSEDLAPVSAEASPGPADDTTSQSDASQAGASCLDGKSALEDVTCIMIRDEGQSTDLDSSSLADDSFEQSSFDTTFSTVTGDPDRSFLRPRSAPSQPIRLPALPPASPSLKSDKRKAGTIAQAVTGGRRRKSKKDQLKAAAGMPEDRPPELLT